MMTGGANNQEARLRDGVAGVTRLLNDLGLLGYSGHVSARLPEGDRFLIQSFDQSRASLAPEDLLVSDLDGRKLAGPAGAKLPSEVYIHSEILRARPDIQAVAHFHHDLSTTFTLVEDVKLVPIKNHAVRWADGIPEHGDPSHVSTPELGRALAATLAEHHALQIRAHGQVVTAESLPALLVDCVHFTENAEALFRAHTLGQVRPLSESELASFLADFHRDRHVPKLWHYYVGRARARGVLPAEWELE
jgi:L-ribulose-5-phosphate 4-epimerase